MLSQRRSYVQRSNVKVAIGAAAHRRQKRLLGKKYLSFEKQNYRIQYRGRPLLVVHRTVNT
jgi:hypothetical protein